jgi:hypothetical protein
MASAGEVRLLLMFPIKQSVPQGLKALINQFLYGTAEAVPFVNLRGLLS